MGWVGGGYICAILSASWFNACRPSVASARYPWRRPQVRKPRRAAAKRKLPDYAGVRSGGGGSSSAAAAGGLLCPEFAYALKLVQQLTAPGAGQAPGGERLASRLRSAAAPVMDWSSAQEQAQQALMSEVLGEQEEEDGGVQAEDAGGHPISVICYYLYKRMLGYPAGLECSLDCTEI